MGLVSSGPSGCMWPFCDPLTLTLSVTSSTSGLPTLTWTYSSWKGSWTWSSSCGCDSPTWIFCASLMTSLLFSCEGTWTVSSSSLSGIWNRWHSSCGSLTLSAEGRRARQPGQVQQMQTGSAGSACARTHQSLELAPVFCPLLSLLFSGMCFHSCLGSAALPSTLSVPLL